MVSVEDAKSPQHRMISYKSVEDDQVSIHSAASIVTLDSELGAKSKLESVMVCFTNHTACLHISIYILMLALL